MKDEVKITVIATGFKDMPLGREQSIYATSSGLHVPEARLPARTRRMRWRRSESLGGAEELGETGDA